MDWLAWINWIGVWVSPIKKCQVERKMWMGKCSDAVMLIDFVAKASFLVGVENVRMQIKRWNMLLRRIFDLSWFMFGLVY